MRRGLLALIVGLVSLSTGKAQEPPTFETLNRALSDEVVIPAYERHAQAMAGLEAATHTFCDDPTDAKLAATKDAYHRAMDAWQEAQPISFGPISWKARASRVQFWPDKGGAATRQVKQALQKQDPDLIAEGGLQGKSVALQNLTTYERIVFERGEVIVSDRVTAGDRYACALAAAITRFQIKLAREVLADWTEPGGYREIVNTAPRGNEHYIDAKEVAVQFLKSLSGTLDVAVRLKLERPLGKTIEKARPRRAESWRSSRSLANIIANLETAHALYATPGGFGDLLAAAGAEPLDIGLRGSFEAAIAEARALSLPLHEAVAVPEARERLLVLLEQLKNLRLLIGGPVADEIGLVVGFNALDGD